LELSEYLASGLPPSGEAEELTTRFKAHSMAALGHKTLSGLFMQFNAPSVPEVLPPYITEA